MISFSYEGIIMGELNATEYKRFEAIKHIRDDGSEYWIARELSIELDYAQWRNFSSVLDKARLACKNSGFDIDDHFAEVSKMVEIGSGTNRRVIDFELSRYACYLVVQNGAPRKEVIALGQTYFAYKRDAKKSRIISINLMRIINGSLYAAISNNGTNS
jgi:DNA-damage-inducible protein D